MDYFKSCTLCPKSCSINRHNSVGFCKANDKMHVARADLYYYEEPPISGKNGSGAIFFSFCNMKCIFCQNYDISTLNIGKEISVDKFCDICLNLQKKGANNINLITPTHYIPLIKEGLILAKEKGLNIPIVYNTSSYENVDALKLLDGLIDVYLPDLKYYDDTLAKKYSNCTNYFKYASLAISEMYRQVGNPIFDNNLIKKGVIVRHLMLPEHIDDSKMIIKYLYDTYRDNIYISIMNQYTPLKKFKYNNLNRTITENEYNSLIDYACDIGVNNAFVQTGGTQKKSFIPDFKNQVF